MGKTVVFSNQPLDGQRRSLDCKGCAVKIAGPDESAKYLGRTFCMANHHDVEMNARIASAWAAFMAIKEVLCNPVLELQKRIRLFEAVVTSSVLYGCVAWTMTVDYERKLRSTRRRMLRWMVGCRKQSDEEWVDYMKRATANAEHCATQRGARDWVQQQRFRKWKFAGKTARRDDHRWSQRLLQWTPWFRCVPRRRVGRPAMRWEDCIMKMAGGDWVEVAQDNSLWECLSHGFCTRCA